MGIGGGGGYLTLQMGTLFSRIKCPGGGGDIFRGHTFYYDTRSESPKTDGMEVWTFVLATAVAVADPGRGKGGGGGGGGEGEREQHINNVRHLPQFNG